MDEMEKQETEQTEQQETPEEETPRQEQPKEAYVPRPAWQVWGARVALVVFILFLIMYYVNIMRGNG